MKNIFITAMMLLLWPKPELIAQCESIGVISLNSEVKTPRPDPALVANMARYLNPPLAAERAIFLVPGLNGDHNAWRDLRDELSGYTNDFPSFPARRAEVRMIGTKNGPGYSQAAGLASAAKDVRDQMSNLNYAQLGIPDPGNNIAIGHSQGGLVIRAIEYNDTQLGKKRYFGGMVTFGSPHRGAAILTNGLPVSQGGRGQLSDFIDDFCVAISDGPLQEKLQLSDQFMFKLVRLLKLDDQALSLRDEICHVLADSILPHYILKDFTANITQDYMAHDEFYKKPNYLLNVLNTYQPQIPSVAFYGVEEEPVFWRQLGSITHKVHKYPAFQADPDQNFVDDYALLLANYNARYLIYKKQAEDFETYTDLSSNPGYFFSLLKSQFGFLISGQYITEGMRARRVSNAYKSGAQFLFNANDRWKGIIGARKTSIKQIGYICDCDHITGGYTTTSYVQNQEDCAAGFNSTSSGIVHCEVYPNVTLHVDEFENDGVVLASSARQLPGGIVNPGIPEIVYRLQSTNHQQIRNGGEIARVLLRLMDTPDFANFFLTPRL